MITSEITIKNEAYMTEETAADEMSVHSFTLKFDEEDSSEDEEKEEEGKEDGERLVQLEEKETHL